MLLQCLLLFTLAFCGCSIPLTQNQVACVSGELCVPFPGCHPKRCINAASLAAFNTSVPLVCDYMFVATDATESSCSCSVVPGVNNSVCINTNDEAISSLRLAKERWVQSNITSYEFDLLEVCFCRPYSVHIEVSGGRVINVTNKNTGREIPSAEWRQQLSTVSSMFDWVEPNLALVSSDPQLLIKVKYHELGFVSAYDSFPDPAANEHMPTDMDYGLRVTNFKQLQDPCADRASCSMECPAGFKKDARGCALCECVDVLPRTGCCVKYGFGSMMKECCHKFEDSSSTVCVLPEPLIGGSVRFHEGLTCAETQALDMYQLEVPPPTSDPEQEPPPPPMGCCVKFGFGSMMMPCCHTFTDSPNGQCAAGGIGSAATYYHMTCDQAKSCECPFTANSADCEGYPTCTLKCEYGFKAHQDLTECRVCECADPPAPVVEDETGTTGCCVTYSVNASTSKECCHDFKNDALANCVATLAGEQKRFHRGEECSVTKTLRQYGPPCAELSCQHQCLLSGFQEVNGCPTCHCKDPCDGKIVTDPCDLTCDHGRFVDRDGCTLCTCAVAVCESPSCALTCPFGLQKNADGCYVCACVQHASLSTPTADNTPLIGIGVVLLVVIVATVSFYVYRRKQNSSPTTTKFDAFPNANVADGKYSKFSTSDTV